MLLFFIISTFSAFVSQVHTCLWLDFTRRSDPLAGKSVSKILEGGIVKI